MDKNLETIIEKANNFFNNGNFDKFIEILEPIIENIKNSQILLKYYKSSIITDKKNNPIKYILNALEEEPYNLDILYEIATYYFEKKEIENFNKYAKKISEIQKDESLNFLVINNKVYANKKNKLDYILDENTNYPDKLFTFYRHIILKNLNILDDYLLYEDKVEFWESYFLSKKLNENEIKFLLLFSMKTFDEKSYQENLLIQSYIENILEKETYLLDLAKSELISNYSFDNLLENYQKMLENYKLESEEKITVLIKYLSVFNYVKSNYNQEYKKYLYLFSDEFKNNKKYDFFLNKNNNKIKIGYISQDFRLHSMIYFLQHLYENHNKNEFEIFSYYINENFDNHTEIFKNNSDYWREVYNLKDEEISNIIYNDKIDILIDLSGFTHKSRIKIFSYKPAPVQISMIGYHDSLGLDTIDYKLLDSYLSENIQEYFLEKIINIPDTMFCYKPPINLPNINKLPYLENKYLTFGSFNTGFKITKETINLWFKILKKYENSRMIIKCRQANYSMFKEKIINLFRENNIDTNRIKIFSFINNISNHLEIYNKIDIALDTYPYNGVTTTFESLIMGVPVLTFTGNIVSSRAGKSILSNLGLRNWIISNLNNEINIDIDNLEYLRDNLREKLTSSILCNHKEFTLKLENIYKQILKR